MTADRVPLAFRAQIDGRCQLHYVKKKEDLKSENPKNNDAYLWAEEWLSYVSQNPPTFSKEVKTRSYQITWRFITNDGQDETIIRPIIGSKGHPFYPGSSMKGAFRRALQKRLSNNLKVLSLKGLQYYCGGEDKTNGKSETKPGILRFHGAYPVNDKWKTDSIVDIVHPQENWQVFSGKKEKGENANFMISLLKPKLNFGISSSKELSEAEWDEIWSVWETALGYGIGSRVSAGYGQIAKHEANKILSVYLKGEGLISKRVDGSTEFRPNMFKAALRGHTLRLFGGVTNEATAQALTKKLWGGFAGRDGSIVGELGISFDYKPDEFKLFQGQVPPFELERGQLDLLALNVKDAAREKKLRSFLIKLMKFSMVLGGFGKSWRRSSHELFFSNDNYNRDIGCHWEFIGSAQALYVPFNSVNEIKTYFSELHQFIKQWVTTIEGKSLHAEGTNWREAWHPNRVQVWARFDNDGQAISDALDWLHSDGNQPYSLKRTHLGGRMGQIGRVWQRMYPRFILNSNNEKQRKGFVEFLTIFPEPNAQGQNQQKQITFLSYLKDQSAFQRVW
jgi:CRISPR-associated protein Cmr6